MTEFENDLLKKIIERLDLEDVIEDQKDQITSETILFEKGLGLDSVDGLELVIMVEEVYGIVIQVSERNKSVFGTLGDLATFIQENRNRDK